LPVSCRRFAYFITPHGYGHAARAAAVMEAVCDLAPEVFFEIFTRVPNWFFNLSLQGKYAYHEQNTDVGLVQTTAMVEDLPATIRSLQAFLPFQKDLVQDLAQAIRSMGCEMVLCDISPLGIAVAKEAGLPSILVENFTWDWIYQGYLEEEPGFAPYITYLQQAFSSATWHIRTEPACIDEPPADRLSSVVSRKPRLSRRATREALGIPQDAPMAMITMGGIITEFPFIYRLEQSRDTLFLIPGGSATYEQRGSLVLLPHHSSLYHPDLVNASDAIIGKLGYSTLAEAYNSGIPFAYVPRAKFRESQPMGQFARKVMDAIELEEESFFDGAWLNLLPGLLSRPRRQLSCENGADQVARFILDR